MTIEQPENNENVPVEEHDLHTPGEATTQQADSQGTAIASQWGGGADAVSLDPFYDFDSVSEHEQQHPEQHFERPGSAFSDDSSDEENDEDDELVESNDHTEAQIVDQKTPQEDAWYIWQRTGLSGPPTRAFTFQTDEEHDARTGETVQTVNHFYPYGYPIVYGRGPVSWGSANEQYYRRDVQGSDGRFNVPLFRKGDDNTRPYITGERSKLRRIRSIDDMSPETSPTKRVRLSLTNAGEGASIDHGESSPDPPLNDSADAASPQVDWNEAEHGGPTTLDDNQDESPLSDDEIITDAEKVRPLVKIPDAPSHSASPSLYVPKSGFDWSEEDDGDFNVDSISWPTPPSNVGSVSPGVSNGNNTASSGGAENASSARPQSRCGNRDDDDQPEADEEGDANFDMSNVDDDAEEDNGAGAMTEDAADTNGSTSPADSVDSVTGMTQEEGLSKVAEWQESNNSYLERARQQLMQNFPNHFTRLGEVYPPDTDENRIDRLEAKVHLSREMMDRLRKELAKMANDRRVAREQLACQTDYADRLQEYIDEEFMERDRREQDLREKLAMLSQDGAAEAYFDQTQELAQKLVETEDRLYAAQLELSRTVASKEQAGPESISTQAPNRQSQTCDQSTQTGQDSDDNMTYERALLPRHFVHWPAYIRRDVAEGISMFVTGAHRYETGEIVELTASAVEELMGPEGETPFDEVVSCLKDRGYVFRPDHLASDTETYMRENGFRNIAVMLAARKLDSTNSVGRTRRLLEEIDSLHQRGPPEMRSTMSQEEERRYASVVNELDSCNEISKALQEENELLKHQLEEQQAADIDQTTSNVITASLNDELERLQRVNNDLQERNEKLEQESDKLEVLTAQLSGSNMHVVELKQAKAKVEEDLASTKDHLSQCRVHGEKLTQDVKTLRNELQICRDQLEQHQECDKRIKELEDERARHLGMLQGGYHKIQDVQARKEELAAKMVEHCTTCNHWHNGGHPDSSKTSSTNTTADGSSPQARSVSAAQAAAAYRSRLSAEQAQRLAKVRQSETYQKARQTLQQNKQATKVEDEEVTKMRQKVYASVFGRKEIPYIPREERLRRLQEVCA